MNGTNGISIAFNSGRTGLNGNTGKVGSSGFKKLVATGESATGDGPFTRGCGSHSERL